MKQLLYYTSERYLKIISYPTNTNRIASTNAIIPYSSPFGKIFFHIFSQNINFHFKFINKRLQDAPSKAWLRQKSPTRMHYVLAISQATCSNIEPTFSNIAGRNNPLIASIPGWSSASIFHCRHLQLSRKNSFSSYSRATYTPYSSISSFTKLRIEKACRHPPAGPPIPLP